MHPIQYEYWTLQSETSAIPDQELNRYGDDGWVLVHILKDADVDPQRPYQFRFVRMVVDTEIDEPEGGDEP